jgi:MFS family permease
MTMKPRSKPPQLAQRLRPTARHATGPQPSTRVGARGALSVLLLASTLTVMAGAIIAPVLPLIRGELAIGATAAGLIVTTHGLVIALAAPLVGRLVDRHGPRRTLAGGLTLYGLAGGAGLFVSSYPALIASRIVFGLGAAILFTATSVALLALYSGEARDRVMGWRSSAASLGGVIWPVLGGAIASASWHAPFGVYLLGIPLALAVLLVVPETEPRAPADAASSVSLRELLGQERAIGGVYALMFGSSVLLYGLVVFIPQRLDELGVGSSLALGLPQAAMTAAATATGLLYATLRRHATYATLLTGTAVLWTVAFTALALVREPVLVAGATALFGFGSGLTLPAASVLLGDLTPEHLRGQANSYLGTATFLGQFASPLILGPAVSGAGITTAYAALAVGLVALVTLVVTGHTRIDAATAPPPEREAKA